MKKIWYAPNGFEAYNDEEIQAVTDCLKQGWLAGFGKYSIEFEEKVSKMFNKCAFVRNNISWNIITVIYKELFN